MSTTQYPSLIHVLDELDVKAIEKGWYEDLNNSIDQKFCSVTNAPLLIQHHIYPKLNETYIYDKSIQSYVLLDDNVEKVFSANKIESYITIFGFMGATSVNGKIIELKKKERQLDVSGGVTAKEVEISADYKSKKIEELERTININRKFGEKNIKTYDEVKEYILSRGFVGDAMIMRRLEELRYSSEQKLKGSYTIRTAATHNLDSIMEIGLKVSVTPVFKSNAKLQNRCSSNTEISFELEVLFD